MNNINTLRIGAALFGVSAVIVVGFALYNVLVFRVTSTTPDRASFPTIAPYIDIYFSKPVQGVASYTLNGDHDTGTVSISDKKLRFTYNSTYKANTKYTLTLKGITSKSGDKLDYTYAFTAVYMNFKDVPPEIRQASVDKSSSGQIDDPFFNNYFPMQTDDFQIEHKVYDDNRQSKTLYVTFLSEVFNYDTNTRSTLSDADAEKMRQKVIDYITSRGGKPDNYAIHYSNVYLENKYNKEHLE